MNGQDSRVAAVYTVKDGSVVADHTPNADTADPSKFDLVLQLEAGDPLGNSGAAYHLNIYAVSEDGGAVPAALSPGLFAENWSAANGWKKSGNDWVKTSPAAEPDGVTRYKITIPAGAILKDTTRRFRYNVELISVNFEVTALSQSDPFVLVGF